MKVKHKKSTQDFNIPVKVLEENADFFFRISSNIFNEAIGSSKFPSSLKHANFTPIFKKGSRHQK